MKEVKEETLVDRKLRDSAEPWNLYISPIKAFEENKFRKLMVINFHGWPVFKIFTNTNLSEWSVLKMSKSKITKKLLRIRVNLFFVFVIPLKTLNITTVTSITSSSMSIMSRTKVYCSQINSRLIIFYDFHLKKCLQSRNFWHLGKFVNCKLWRKLSDLDCKTFNLDI